MFQSYIIIGLNIFLLKQINNGKCVDGLDLYLCKSPIAWISSYFLFTMILIYFFSQRIWWNNFNHKRENTHNLAS